MYKVVNAFRDANDEDRFYSVGDAYPGEGVKLTKTRINELKGKNRLGIAFIEEVEDAPENKDVRKDAGHEDKGGLDLDGLLDESTDSATE